MKSESIYLEAIFKKPKHSMKSTVSLYLKPVYRAPEVDVMLYRIIIRYFTLLLLCHIDAIIMYSIFLHGT